MGIVIYTKPGCPYCELAREYYSSKSIPFLENKIECNRSDFNEMISLTQGRATVPVIVEDGVLKQIGWGGIG